VESLLLKLCCGIPAVESLLWNLCCGIPAVESLLWNLCCGIPGWLGGLAGWPGWLGIPLRHSSGTAPAQLRRG